MTILEIGLGAGLSVAMLMIVALVFGLNAAHRRIRSVTVERTAALVEANQARSVAHGEAKAREDIARDVQAVLEPLRLLLEQQATAITRASTNLGAAVTANGQRLSDFDLAIAELQSVARVLKSDEAPVTRLVRREPTEVSRTRRHPSVAPPAPAEALAPEPAQVAAGIGPRPNSRPLPAAGTPHPPPTRVGSSSVRPPAAPPAKANAPRSSTLIGVTPPPAVHAEPNKDGRFLSTPTLVSMRAVVPTDDTGGGS